MPSSMGFQFGLDKNTTIYKQKHRWLLKIPDVSAEGVNALPPLKAARPSISFKELEVQHLNEIVYFPGKPEFKTFTLTLYDIKCRQESPVVKWLRKLYDAKEGIYNFVIDEENEDNNFKVDAFLELYDACGRCMETWVYENAWPQTIDFQDLDMGSSEVVMVEVTLRYDRAYSIDCTFDAQSI